MTPSAPRVSVIVPNYNHSTYLPQRIQSILEQSFQDFELIILDDCSTDASKDVIERYRRHVRVSRIVYNDANSGSTFRQWRKGIGLAAGEYVWLAESDDVSDVRFLEAVVARLDSSPGVGVAYCQSHSCDRTGEVTGDWLHHTARFEPNIWEEDFEIPGREAVQRYFAYLNPIPNASAVVFRKAVYDRTPDAVAVDMTLNGDWFLWIKLLEHSDLAFVSSPLNDFRQHDGRSSHANIENFNNVAEFYEILSYLDARGLLSDRQKDDLKRWLFAVWHKQAGRSLFNPWSRASRNVRAASRSFDSAVGRRKARALLLTLARRHAHPDELADWPPRDAESHV